MPSLCRDDEEMYKKHATRATLLFCSLIKLIAFWRSCCGHNRGFLRYLRRGASVPIDPSSLPPYEPEKMKITIFSDMKINVVPLYKGRE